MTHMERLFTNQIVYVTGAATGIGRACALAFAREGARLALFDIDTEQAARTQAEIAEQGTTVRAFACDVSVSSSVDEAMRLAARQTGPPDVAVNSAGVIIAPASVGDVDEAAWDRVMSINLKGTWLCMKAEIALMLERDGGSIVNIGSTGGLKAAATQGVYNGSKFGVVGLTRGAALDYARAGLRINAVCPGPTWTPLTTGLLEIANESARSEYESLLTLGRWGRPEEIAEAVIWIACGRASLVNGAALPVDGGLLA
jgi:NAD(P)-dependent dehydrogenase (short-subunit alcohol dehydrogenase family)